MIEVFFINTLYDRSILQISILKKILDIFLNLWSVLSEVYDSTRKKLIYFDVYYKKKNLYNFRF